MVGRSAIAAGVLLVGALAASAGAQTLDYSFQFTLPNGGVMEDIVMYASGQGQDAVYLSPSVLGPSGSFSLSQPVGFTADKALIIGVNLGADADHIIMLTNDGFGESAVGFKWSELFPAPNPRHSEIISLMSSAHDGDAAALAALTTFFRGSDAAEAAFDPWGSYTVLQYSVVPPPIGGDVPEPASLSLLAVGGAALLWRRRQR